MSARGATWVSLCLAGWMGCIAVQAQAQDWRQWATPLQDPLFARPPQLNQAASASGASPTNACSPGQLASLADHPLALAEVVDIGLCANPQIQGAWAAIKVQAAARGEARASYLPTVTAGVARVNDRTVYPNGELPETLLQGETESLGVNWRLWDFGGRSANNAAAASALDAALASHNAALQKIMETLIGAYFDAQTAQSALEAKEQAESLAGDTLQASKRREARGAGAQTDTLQAATALARASLDKSRAKGDLQKAMAVLQYAMGLTGTASLKLQRDVQDGVHDLPEDLNVWLEQVQQTHPAILAAQAQLLAAQHKVTATESDGLPTIDLAYNAYQNGRPGQGLPSIHTVEGVASVTLNIPVFEGFARTYKVRGAQAQVEQSQATLDDTIHQTLMSVVKTYADAQAARDNLQASQLLLSSAQDALHSVQRKFERGASDILELLTVQAALADAQAQRIRCLAEWKSARLRLLAGSGRLGLDVLAGNADEADQARANVVGDKQQ